MLRTQLTSLLACIAATWILTAYSTAHADQLTARGTVFADRNGNGQRDAGEPGIPGVRVSNGLEVVATDGAGDYELPIDADEAEIFLLKPRDWMTPQTDQHLPRFYYLHKPHGSPDDGFAFAGVEPTGPLPETIDFPLVASPEPDEFKVIMMGDPQPYNRREVRYYANDCIAELIDTDAAFGMSLGDIVGDKLSLFEYVNAVQGAVGVPWYNVLGNHDQNYYSPDDAHSDESYERIYGPANYAFQYGPVHFIVLDNVEWQGFHPTNPDEKPAAGNYKAGLSERQLGFVANYVAGVPQDERIVVCVHIPLVVPEWRGGSGPELRKLLEILSGHPHTMSFSAHTHFNQDDFAGEADGYHPHGGGEHHHHNTATGSGSWYRGPKDEAGIPMTAMADGAPNGYVIATFKGNDYKLRYKAARMPADYQMSIHAPEVIPAADTAAEVLANVFNGNGHSTVRMRVRGHGDWIPMKNVRRPDPAFAAAKVHDDPIADAEKRTKMPAPLETPHMWAANLPADLPPGVHVVEVEATDMFDQVDRGIHLIEVE
ncbi:MAG: calcineurin-like phosphoesterase family protein [Planctomycetales bacterium]|nr:calcineurin-like phosphoesterase family protein [Planctomycetales bacterium]